ncbi:hypothetical protein DL96DRAFT_1817971 [Flagelloscypha sp. PMI_526]|nr:hypothetical protein DL96DRAFT_1817971 [Flagelloscypha sp. PMI_526]
MDSPILLPSEVIGKIVEIAADSGSNSSTLRLCFVSKLFHQSASGRLYHTLTVLEDHLAMILYQSIPLRPWIATCVRVLSVRTCSQGLMNEALNTFTYLRALRVPRDTALDPTCIQPTLCWLVQISDNSIPIKIAQNLTHLFFYGLSFECISQVTQGKKYFPCLTHVAVVESFSWQSSTHQALDLLCRTIPSELPTTLQVFLLMFIKMGHILLESNQIMLEKVQNILELDSRIVFWKEAPDDIPAEWNGPRFFDYHTYGHAVDQALGVLPDGANGIWEEAERWIQSALHDRSETGDFI